ncbi:MAG: C25 family cysteine peptidase, partial [Candidatus Zophobacter franzmannii]|nr:C25 family cysteine peptidase [Candidatus Zophobacter franzmannii]
MRARTMIALFMLLLVSTVFAVLDVQQSSDDMLKIRFNAGEYKVSDSDNYSTITNDGLFRTDLVGLPDLPFYEFKVAVPQNGDIAISTSILNRQSHSLRLPLQPVPRIVDGKDVDEYLYEMSSEYKTYKNELQVVKGEYTEFRRSAFIPVRIYPYSYDATTRMLSVAKDMDISIAIIGNTKAVNKLSEKENQLISRLVINPESATNWKVDRGRSNINYIDYSKSNQWYRFTTTQQGIAEITYSDLSNIPLGDVDPRTIRVFSTGGKLLNNSVSEEGYEFAEIPITIAGENDGSFDSSDRIILYVEGRDIRRKNLAISQSLFKNPYSAETVYWLTFAGNFSSPPLRITGLNDYHLEDVERNYTQYPFTYRKENERFRRTQMGFQWYDYLMSGSTTTTYNFDIPASDVAPTQGTYSRFELSVREQDSDVYSSRHEMTIDFNDEQITNTSWIGQSAKYVSLNEYTPVNGTNDVDVKIHRTQSDVILLDYIKIVYERLLAKRNQQYKLTIMDRDENIVTKFDFTKDSTSNLHIFQVDDFNKVWAIDPVVNGNDFYFLSNCTQVGGEYTVPTEYFVAQESDLIDISALEAYYPEDIATISVPIDYLIITPEEYKDQAERIHEIYTNSRALECKVVTMTSVFDQFNGGMPDPGAIRSYIEYLFEEGFSSDSMAVVLLGSGTYDWRNNSGQSANKNKCIIYMDNSGLTSDDYFVMFRQDTRPEMPIGRIPAQNLSDMELFVDRIDAWNSGINPGWWRNTVVFFADDENNGSASGEYYHSEQLEDASQVIHRSVISEKIFAYDYELDEYQNKPDARNDFIDKINEGTLIWYYIGHGSYDKLGTEDY